MTTHRYAVAVRVRDVPDGVKQADLDRAIQAAVEHSTAREALEEALAAILGSIRYIGPGSGGAIEVMAEPLYGQHGIVGRVRVGRR